MEQLFMNALNKRAASFAKLHECKIEDIKICYRNGIFSYQLFIEGVLKMEREFNL